MPRLTTVVIWALAAASVVFWTLRLQDMAGASAAVPVAQAALVADTQGLRKLLGAQAAPVALQAPSREATRYQLLGVLAGTTSQGGAAIIAVNGQPARPYRVGTRIGDGDGDDLYLQSLQGRQARLGASLDGPASVVLELPEFKPAAAAPTGTNIRPGPAPMVNRNTSLPPVGQPLVPPDDR